MGYPFISIIIPTYHDGKRLQLCIEALDSQSYPKDNFEIIVVNNDPDDREDYSFLDSHVYITEGKAGSYAARNAALAIAKGDILAFTDSDCIPQYDWLENAYNYFLDSSIDRIAGKVEIFCEDERSKTWIEIYEKVFAFDQQRNVELLKGAVTANLFAKRNCFDTVGNFDETKKSGEDFGWNRRANAAGFSLRYAADVIVAHPARRTYKELSDKRKRVFGGHKIFREKNTFKKIIYPAVLFYNYYAYQHVRLFKSNSVSLSDKFKVSWIILYLLLVTEIEYFRLLLGKKPNR